MSTLGAFVIVGEGDEALPTTIGAGAVIRSHSVIYCGNQIGENFQTGHGVLVRELNRIGFDVSVGSHSVIEHHVQIGNRVRIHSNVFIPEYSDLADDAWVGPSVVFTNARYPRSRGVKDSLVGPKIGANAKIGAGATLLPGVVIGEGALVGAGAVVVHDVPPFSVVVGNPARVVRRIDEIHVYTDS